MVSSAALRENYLRKIGAFAMLSSSAHYYINHALSALPGSNGSIALENNCARLALFMIR